MRPPWSRTFRLGLWLGQTKTSLTTEVIWLYPLPWVLCTYIVSPHNALMLTVFSIPLGVALCVLLYLHRRNVKKLREEDAKDPHRSLDFGLDDGPMGTKKKDRMSRLLGGGEKPSHKTNQLSMDMNLSSPYLLPAQDVGSHDSVHTLTRGYPTELDPYRMVPSEVGSIRSFGGPGKRASANSSRTMGTMRPPPRQGSFPRSPISPTYQKEDPFASPSPPEPVHQRPAQPELQEPILPVKSIPEIASVPYPEEPSIQQPPLVADRSSPQHDFEMPGVAQSDNIGMAYDGGDFPRPPSNSNNHGSGGLGLEMDLHASNPQINNTFDEYNSPDYNQMSQAVTTSDARHSKDSYYGEDQPNIQTSEYYDDQDFGRARGASLDNEQTQAQQGLGVPAQSNKRLSVGFRPLPPDEVTQSEDPEYRANRIRSFYKEYFGEDDGGGEPAPPMPAMPPQHGGPQRGYYDEYDDNYMGDAAYFDPETNAFVMPGAQPVHRRAMTPPPAGRRPYPGPPGPYGGPRNGSRGPRPRGPGSVGGMSAPRSRAGSAFGSRAGSSLGPRPDSSASARGRQPPRKNLPPPADLPTLPAPSKLKDDSFALLNAADFAPPEAFGSRARGRSQSPLGERRAYQPKVPAVSPLVNSYDELNALPSP